MIVVDVNTMANFVDKCILNNLEPSDAIEDEFFSKVIYKKATEAIDEIKEIIENFLELIPKQYCYKCKKCSAEYMFYKELKELKCIICENIIYRKNDKKGYELSLNG